MRHGSKPDGFLMETFDSPEGAYDAARSAYDESRLFHEVVIVSPTEQGLND